MTIKRRGCVAYGTLVMMTLGLTANATASADECSMLPGNIELRVVLTDEIGNPVDGNNFVKGEVILVRTTLSSLDALEARAQADAAETGLNMLQKNGMEELAAKFAKDLTAAENRLIVVNRQLADQPLADRAKQLMAEAVRQSTTGGATPMALSLSRLANKSPERVPGQAEGAVAEVVWSLDSATVDCGTVSIRVAPPITKDGTATSITPAEIRFSLLSVEKASSDTLCRAAYVKAHVAIEAKRFKDAVKHAEEASRLGDPLGYYRLASFHVLGHAHETLGETKAALDAYHQTLVIIEKAFPKAGHTRLDLKKRIRKLEARSQN